MKKGLVLCAVIAGSLICNAQTVTDNFNVGPYVVDYNGQGDVKYRLRDNIDLYEFFELRKDTVVLAQPALEPVKHAIAVSLRGSANHRAAKDYGIEGVWKQNIGNNLFFNGGLSLAVGYADYGDHQEKRSMFEAGIPLQLELGKLNREKGSLYGLFGLTPTVFSTMSATTWNGVERVDDIKKSGFLLGASLEFGGNVPVGRYLMRFGIYGTYKINCTPSDYDVYAHCAGTMFFGAKIGIVL